MEVYDRQSKKLITEHEYKDNLLKFLYSNVFGRVLLKYATNPKYSIKKSEWRNSKASKNEVIKFINEYNIKLDACEISAAEDFETFNSFFTRKPVLKISKSLNNEILSCAESKLSYYNIDDKLRIQIKGTTYSLQELLSDKFSSFENIENYRNGVCVVYRLGLSDIHRYYILDNCKCICNYNIDGVLHTVRPIASAAGYKVFAQNKREVFLFDTENFGKVIQVNIGALLVGKMITTANINANRLNKMDELGYFEFGGSTIVQIIDRKLRFDQDIELYNAQGIETQVHIGEKIATYI